MASAQHQKGVRKMVGLFALACILSVLGAGRVSGECMKVSGLPFCSMINYTVNTTAFAVPGNSPLEQDKLVQAWYNKYASDQLQTADCLDSWKSYICSFYFPMCPYCTEVHGICRRGCLALTARCARQVQDFMGACYGGDLFVNDTNNVTPCTPYVLSAKSDPLFTCTRVPPAYASFCQPKWMVASAPHNNTEVWVRMDNVTQTRWSTFASAGVSDACKESLRVFFCAEYFAPCNDQDQLANPLADVLQPLCTQLKIDCPLNMVNRVCSFNPYTPPDPNHCQH